MPTFTNAEACSTLISQYFKYTEGEHEIKRQPVKNPKEGEPEFTEIKIWLRDPQPPLISELALHLGFNSLQEFDDYQRNGEYAHLIKRAHLQIEAGYERKLHQQAPTGAIFVLKAMGWNEKSVADEKYDIPKSLQVNVVHSGPKLAGSESEVEL